MVKPRPHIVLHYLPQFPGAEIACIFRGANDWPEHQAFSGDGDRSRFKGMKVLCVFVMCLRDLRKQEEGLVAFQLIPLVVT